jgi:hypothetical protein
MSIRNPPKVKGQLSTTLLSVCQPSSKCGSPDVSLSLLQGQFNLISQTSGILRKRKQYGPNENNDVKALIGIFMFTAVFKCGNENMFSRFPDSSSCPIFSGYLII